MPPKTTRIPRLPEDEGQTELAFESPLWKWSGEKGSWHFVTIPKGQSDLIRFIENKSVGGFGSVKVRVSIGASTWETSVFPMKEKTYLLPIKSAIRLQENLSEWSLIKGVIHLI